jgi:hypothetical protein
MFLYCHHVTYVVYSIREMAEFLEANFDMKPFRADIHPSYGMRTILYKCDRTLMEFVEPIIDDEGNALVDSHACRLFANMLRETGPGLFHVAWAVNDIAKTYKDLKAKGNKMDAQGHDGPLHDSLHPFYQVFNIIPTSIGPTYAKAVRGVFFQCAEGVPSQADLDNKGNLDLSSLPERWGGTAKWAIERDLGDVVEG